MKTRMLVVVALIVGVANVNAVVIPVTSVADSGVGSLRNALASAANGDVIDATGHFRNHLANERRTVGHQ